MYISEINSTNDYLKQHPTESLIRTDFQTSGRGQWGNSWESERGQNLLFSVRLHPQIAASTQWSIAMRSALALYQTAQLLVATPQQDKVRIKWPNDLYYEDHKLAGILVEHTLGGEWITDSIIGIGFNLNQTVWRSAAPNPISLAQITGQVYDADSTMNRWLRCFEEMQAWDIAQLKRAYMAALYRKEGWYWWEEREVNMQPTMNGRQTAQSFRAQIADITSQGQLMLRLPDGECKVYHFKQIRYIY